VLSALSRILYWTLRPAWRLILRVLPHEDPWTRLQYRVPVHRYGLGAKHDFAWYFEGDSGVSAENIGDVCDWLLSCEYVRDPELFHEADFWQHPRTFEQLRRGDCEDHALWAWRKLVELGYDADLVSGRQLPWDPDDPRDQGGHVWVIFRHNGEQFLFETVAKDRHRMVGLLTEAAHRYRPEFGVDRNRERFAFNGVLHSMRDRELGVKRVSARHRTA
jgi:hypothetical protein